jgi:signal transduction histidine kinase
VIDTARLRTIPLFTGLGAEQLGELAAAGEEVAFSPGDELFHEGEHADFWWVLLDGAAELLRYSAHQATVVGHLDTPGRWAGGFRAWDDRGVYLATARGVVSGHVLRVPAQALRELFDRWFPLGGHLVEGLYRTARTIESTARQRDSLVTLGTLAAGMAHELNNPAAASARAVDALESSVGGLLASLGRLAEHGTSPARFSQLDALRRELRATGPPAAADAAVAVGSSEAVDTLQPVDTLEAVDREDAVAAWLERHDVRRPWDIAPALAAAGADPAWCERVGDALGPDALDAGLEWVASTVTVSSLLGEVKESTRRISELVAAVRSYTQLDRAQIRQVDVTEGLESTLTMLGHKLKGITVVRDYDPAVPQVEAYAGELNQVWTNLIDNAVDAMDGAGELRVTARRGEPGEVVVEVADTGHGMPPGVVARAFEAFYTTKDVGRGTGLGLDIARRVVVEHHGGDIDIESEPGRTVLRVRLPVRQGERRTTGSVPGR